MKEFGEVEELMNMGKIETNPTPWGGVKNGEYGNIGVGPIPLPKLDNGWIREIEKIAHVYLPCPLNPFSCIVKFSKSV